MADVSYRSVLFLIKFLFIVEIVLFVCSCMLVRARSSFVMQEPWDRMGFQKSRQSCHGRDGHQGSHGQFGHDGHSYGGHGSHVGHDQKDAKIKS